MSKPSSFPVVVHFTFALTISCYVLVGGLGYLTFGRDAEGNITDNLKATEQFQGPVFILATFLVAVTSTSKCILSSYPLTNGLIDMIFRSSYFKKRSVPLAANLSGLILANSDDWITVEESIPTDSMVVGLDGGLNSSRMVVGLDYGSIDNDYKFSYSNNGSSDEIKEETTLEQDNMPEQGLNYFFNDKYYPSQLSEQNLQQQRQNLQESQSKTWKERFVVFVKILIRTMVPIIALGLRAVLPNFITLMGLIGAIFGLQITLIIPVLCYLRIFRGQLSLGERFLLILLLIGGCVAIVSGVWFLLNEKD
jgi:amino acid permease